MNIKFPRTTYHTIAPSTEELYCLNMYIPNSIKVALAIGHWQLGIGHWAFGRTEHNAMLRLSDRPTIASQCAIVQFPKQPLLN